MRTTLTFLMLCFLAQHTLFAQNKRPRDYGIHIGVLSPGKLNAITDVAGVRVGHFTLNTESHIRTGATAIVPHLGNIYQRKVPAAIYIGNGFGKLAGYSQVEELGNLETPILLTNTLNVPEASAALIDYTLVQEGNLKVQSVNALVGETNDGFLNDIRGRYLQKDHFLQAINNAASGNVLEGNIGAGTGTVCFGFKGGIGTASRVLPEILGGYTLGVLVQTNFGGALQIDGVPVGEALEQFAFRDEILKHADGSCIIVVATDAPLDARNLKRLAKRAMLGLGKTGGIVSNGSGDYVIAFSTANGNFIDQQPEDRTQAIQVLSNDYMSPLFMAAIEATEEAIINSLFAAETMTGRENHTVKAIPVEAVVKIMQQYQHLGE